MREFAKSEGFFFYALNGSLEDLRLSRMWNHQGGDADNYKEFAGNECHLMSQGSHLYEEYQSPDFAEVARFKSKEERGEWKADIL